MTALTFPSATFDIVIDKAAMDALMVDEGDVWNPSDEVVRKSGDMCTGIARVLKTKGLHLHVSFAQPHFRNKYLLGQHRREGEKDEGEKDEEERVRREEAASQAVCDFGWSLDHETIAGDGGDGCFHHFFYVMQMLE